jgi:enoyl-CoA hydratase/carnithine racemase
MSAPVLLERDGPVRIVTFNRPEKLNAANRELHERFAAVWPRLAADEEARSVVVTGAGRAFSAGGDYSFLEAVTGEPVGDELAKALHDATVAWMEGVLTLPAPVIAAVNGPAIGFGAAVAALCDLVVMAEDAYLAEPHASYRLAPSPAIELVWPRLTSAHVSKELTMTGRRVGGAEAVRLGLANRVVPPGDARQVAVAWAHELAAADRRGVRLAKEAHNRPVLEDMRARAGSWGRGDAPVRDGA